MSTLVPDSITPTDDRVEVHRTPEGTYICHECGREFVGIAQHWAKADNCDMPRFSGAQREMLTGILLVSGGITNVADKNPHFRYEHSNLTLQKAIREYFGVLARDLVEVDKSDSQAAMEELNANAADRDFGVVQQFSTRSNDYFLSWLDPWYDDGDRTIPADITPTPLMLRLAYALNGSVISDSRDYVRIPMSRTKPSDEVLDRLFGRFGLKTNRGESNGYPYVHTRLYNINAFFDYIGWEPVPGCEDKWPTPGTVSEPDCECPTCHGRYERLGNHWSNSNCTAPPIESPVKEYVLGAVLANGVIRKRGEADTAMLELRSTNEDALQWVEERLGWLAVGISEIMSPAETSEGLSEMLGEEVTGGSYYALRTWDHPELTEYHSDPDGVGRRFPATVTPSPAVLAVPMLTHGRLITRGSGEVERLVLNSNRTAISLDRLGKLYADFDAHTETNTRSIVVVKDVGGFLEETGLNRDMMTMEGD